jgi:hypothetical protein
MRRHLRKLFAGVAVAAAAALGAAGERPMLRLSTELRVAPPIADPALVPGIARCTSDGRCTVTDAGGTRAGTPLVVEP